MRKTTLILIAALVLVSGVAYTYYGLNKKHAADAERWAENYAETSKNVQQISLTLNDFKKVIDKKTDSILKVAGIKQKNVTQVTNYNTYYNDTTENEVKIIYEQIKGIYDFVDNTGCFEFSGYIDMFDTIPQLNVTGRKFYSDFTEIEYVRKDTINFLGLDLVKWWQKPDITYTIIDNCSGEKKIRKINVQ